MLLLAGNFDLSRFFFQLEYDHHMWDGINLPPEFNDDEFSQDCFILYRPVKVTPNVFHEVQRCLQ